MKSKLEKDKKETHYLQKSNILINSWLLHNNQSQKTTEYYLHRTESNYTKLEFYNRIISFKNEGKIKHFLDT